MWESASPTWLGLTLGALLLALLAARCVRWRDARVRREKPGEVAGTVRAD